MGDSVSTLVVVHSSWVDTSSTGTSSGAIEKLLWGELNLLSLVLVVSDGSGTGGGESPAGTTSSLVEDTWIVSGSVINSLENWGRSINFVLNSIRVINSGIELVDVTEILSGELFVSHIRELIQSLGVRSTRSVVLLDGFVVLLENSESELEFLWIGVESLLVHHPNLVGSDDLGWDFVSLSDVIEGSETGNSKQSSECNESFVHHNILLL
jgi:hypothetical protein